MEWGEWTVMLEDGPKTNGICYPLRERNALFVTGWRPTDRMTLPGSRGGRSLKRLFADAGISPWQRDAMPVLRVGETAAAVPGIGVDSKFWPRNEDAVSYITFHHKTEERDYEK